MAVVLAALVYGSIRRAVAALGALFLVATIAHAAGDAEYAIRWDPSEGGPASVSAVLSVLGVSGGAPKKFVVRYFSVTQPTGLPVESAAIARERTADGEIESTYKVRGPQAFPNGSKWNCPMKGGESKEEMDVSVLAANEFKRSHSLSCTRDGSLAAHLPESFAAKPRACSSSVQRTKARDIKVELWSLPSGRSALEVSWGGKDQPKDLEVFLVRVFRPLQASGVKPLRESKTELGSSC